ncbi:MAG: FeoB-associated Cys-rich membrane protein [Phascolarctobacterium sp.]|nr:FeoB-associated Cys-rich membrane protein [Phascolarctobacterium sp.]
MATWIVALVVIGVVYLAAKHVYRTHKQGGCVGCSAGNKGCCHCTNIKAPKVKQQR